MDCPRRAGNGGEGEWSPRPRPRPAPRCLQEVIDMELRAEVGAEMEFVRVAKCNNPFRMKSPNRRGQEPWGSSNFGEGAGPESFPAIRDALEGRYPGQPGVQQGGGSVPGYSGGGGAQDPAGFYSPYQWAVPGGRGGGLPQYCTWGVGQMALVEEETKDWQGMPPPPQMYQHQHQHRNPFLMGEQEDVARGRKRHRSPQRSGKREHARVEEVNAHSKKPVKEGGSPCHFEHEEWKRLLEETFTLSRAGPAPPTMVAPAPPSYPVALINARPGHSIIRPVKLRLGEAPPPRGKAVKRPGAALAAPTPPKQEREAITQLRSYLARKLEMKKQKEHKPCTSTWGGGRGMEPVGVEEEDDSDCLYIDESRTASVTDEEEQRDEEVDGDREKKL